MAAFIVALTGGIASGKSEVERRFAALGVPVIDADLIARELVEPGHVALTEIVTRFGSSVLASDGSLDRRGLRARVFADPGARKDLESILHPRIRTEMKSRAIDAVGPYALLAIPLLTENAAAYAWVDRVLVVDVPRERQIERLLLRDGISRQLALAMLAALSGREHRLAIADDVIDIDGPLDALDGLVFDLHRRYLDFAARARVRG